ncbi:hypothetical protein [Thalassospira mesophila]|uniref:DUF1127 domain-containing protein n=1 Tax=Thalassospira mesophila TaxID=1293891 RepID=A0A1Y2L2R8_9PROT|nr:hypothetical protein [Thalassospira mesophila]OSQ39504.1 hypothetical protein TMES_05585 [Thalassospira mesophila]
MSGYMPTTLRNVNTLGGNRPGVGMRDASSIWGWLHFLEQKWLKHRKIARDAAWLRNAPAHLLHDIGLSRDEIDRVCKTGRKDSGQEQRQ